MYCQGHTVTFVAGKYKFDTRMCNRENKNSSWGYKSIARVGRCRLMLRSLVRGNNPHLDNMSVDILPIPVPAAIWLFGTALIGLVGINRGRKST